MTPAEQPVLAPRLRVHRVDYDHLLEYFGGDVDLLSQFRRQGRAITVLYSWVHARGRDQVISTRVMYILNRVNGFSGEIILHYEDDPRDGRTLRDRVSVNGISAR